MTSAALPASALRHVSDVMVVKPYGILVEEGEEAGLGVGQDRGAFFALLSCCLTSTEARWPIRDGDRVGRGRESERLDRGNRPPEQWKC